MADLFYQRRYNERTGYHEEFNRDFIYPREFRDRRLEILGFNGYGLDGWMLQAERHFFTHRFSNHEKLEAVRISFVGQARLWLQQTERVRPILAWEELKILLLEQFGEKIARKQPGQFPVSNQVGSVHEFRRLGYNNTQLKREKWQGDGCNKELPKQGDVGSKFVDRIEQKFQEILRRMDEIFGHKDDEPKRVLSLTEERDSVECRTDARFNSAKIKHEDELNFKVKVSDDQIEEKNEEAEINSEETTQSPGEVHGSGYNEEEPNQLSNSENFEREISLVIEDQHKTETGKLIIGVANDHLVEEYSPKEDLSGWISDAYILFDKMPKKYYDMKFFARLGIYKAAGNHTRWEGFGTFFGKIIDTSKDSVGAIFVFDPGGSDFNFSPRSTLRTRWKFGGQVMLCPNIGILKGKKVLKGISE